MRDNNDISTANFPHDFVKIIMVGRESFGSQQKDSSL